MQRMSLTLHQRETTTGTDTNCSKRVAVPELIMKCAQLMNQLQNILRGKQPTMNSRMENLRESAVTMIV